MLFDVTLYVQGVPSGFTQSDGSRVNRDNLQILFFIHISGLRQFC